MMERKRRTRTNKRTIANRRTLKRGFARGCVCVCFGVAFLVTNLLELLHLYISPSFHLCKLFFIFLIYNFFLTSFNFQLFALSNATGHIIATNDFILFYFILFSKKSSVVNFCILISFDNVAKSFL
jgi:hypothetical protein